MSEGSQTPEAEPAQRRLWDVLEQAKQICMENQAAAAFTCAGEGSSAGRGGEGALGDPPGGRACGPHLCRLKVSDGAREGGGLDSTQTLYQHQNCNPVVTSGQMCSEPGNGLQRSRAARTHSDDRCGGETDRSSVEKGTAQGLRRRGSMGADISTRAQTQLNIAYSRGEEKNKLLRDDGGKLSSPRGKTSNTRHMSGEASR